MEASVEYLGHKVDADGLHPTKEKVASILVSNKPNNVEELCIFLGLVNYYGKFMPNLSNKLAPVYFLLGNNVQWKWTSEYEKAFQDCKKCLTSDSLLVHYDVKKPLHLACDVSPYGVGCVISHTMPNVDE